MITQAESSTTLLGHFNIYLELINLIKLHSHYIYGLLRICFRISLYKTCKMFYNNNYIILSKACMWNVHIPHNYFCKLNLRLFCWIQVFVIRVFTLIVLSINLLDLFLPMMPFLQLLLLCVFILFRDHLMSLKFISFCYNGDKLKFSDLLLVIDFIKSITFGPLSWAIDVWSQRGLRLALLTLRSVIGRLSEVLIFTENL